MTSRRPTSTPKRASKAPPKAPRARSKPKSHDLATIEPAAFFEEFLVERYAEGLARSAAPAGYDLVVHVELSGEGGGSWGLHFDPSGLTVTRGQPGRKADVRVFQSLADWFAVVRGELGGPSAMLAAARAKPAPVLPLDASSRDRLRRLDGTLTLSVRHFQGRDWRLGIHFGGGSVREPADTSFSMSLLDFQSLASAGKTPNLQALMLGGALRIEGNFALAGELAAIAATHAQATFGRHLAGS